MKFSVEVETESQLFENVRGMMKEKPSPLHWDIQVEVVQKAAEESKSKSVPSTNKKSVMLSSIPESRATPQPATAMKKMSSTSELLARMGKGKKVRYN